MIEGDTRHSDPAAAFIDAIAEAVAERLAREGLLSRPPVSAAMAAVPPTAQSAAAPVPQAISEALHLKPFYTARELALRWAFGTKEKPRTQSVYEIPEWDLPRRKVGANRGSVIFSLLDVLTYEGTITDEERDAIRANALRLVDQATPPRPIRALHPAR